MQPFKTVFVFTGVMNDTESDKYATVQYVNEIITKAAISLGGQGYLQKVNESTFPSQSEQINNLLLQDNSESEIEFENCDHSISILRGDNNKGPALQHGFRYDLTFELTSVEYTCIQILPNNTFVCYRDETKEIKFFATNNYTKAIIAN